MSQPIDYHSRPYRPCVGIMLINSVNQIFVGQRFDNHGDAWQMPQGGIDAGETPIEAGFREMHEEIGTNKAELLCEHPEWLSYNIPEGLANQLWDGKYRGQTQKWLAFRYIGDDADINIATEQPEFCEWRWSSVDSLHQLAVPFKRLVYSKIIADFKDIFAD